MLNDTMAANQTSFRARVVGIAGGTGSGKTTLARRLAQALPEGSVSVLTYDTYYRPRDLDFEGRCTINYDHPEALDRELLCQHVAALKRGEAVHTPTYDYATHLRRTETLLVPPAPVVLVEGILVLVEPALRELMDLKLFVDTPADLRMLRRAGRDMVERGRTFESVQAQYQATVRPMHAQFVEPSKAWADIIIPDGGHNDAALSVLVGYLQDFVATHTAPRRPTARATRREQALMAAS